MKYLRLSPLFISVFFATSCLDKELDPKDPVKSFGIAKEPYEAQRFDLAVKKLGEFRTKFPYSNLATEAELLIANSYFSQGDYPEAAAEYSEFIKLHPKHAQVPFAQYRIGESYWAEAPDSEDREQELTLKAVESWEELAKHHPDDPKTQEAMQLIEKGKTRIAAAERFVSKFYCRQEIWNACAYRSERMILKYHDKKDLLAQAYRQATKAFKYLAQQKGRLTPKEVANPPNIYVRDFTEEQLLDKSVKYEMELDKL